MESSPEGYCESCYYALRRLSLGDGEFQHNFIGQTFFSDRNGSVEDSYFAIRKAIGNVLYTIDSSEGKPKHKILIYALVGITHQGFFNPQK